MNDFFITKFLQKFFRTQRGLFTFFGAAFGTTFPVGAIIIDWLIHDYPFDIVLIVQKNPLHVLIATAPLVLGFLARLAGIRDDRIALQHSQIEKINSTLTNRNQEMDDIFSHIDQGILTINNDFSINKEYSHFCEFIFQRNDLTGVNFLNLIYPLGPAKEKKELREYLELLFTNVSANDDMLKELNPIIRFEYALTEEKGEVKIKYLIFEFVRILVKNQINKVMVIIKDLTEETNREKQHLKERREYEEELERISAIIQVNPEELQDFIRRYEEVSPFIERLFSSSPRNREEKEKRKEDLKSILSSLHALKGEARLYNLTDCAQKIHLLESKCRSSDEESTTPNTINQTMEVMLALSEYKIAIHSIKSTLAKMTENLIKQTNPKNSNFLASDFLAQLELLKNNLSQIINNIGQNIDTQETHEPKAENWVDELPRLQEKTIEDLKKIGENRKLENLKIENFLSEANLKKIAPLKAAIIQLIQNSVVHGIEEPMERVQKGKKDKGQIHLTLKQNDNSIQIIVADDGQGVNVSKLREKLIEQHILTSEKANQLRDDEIISYIFHSGFSSASQKSEIAGHGLGLDMVKRLVNQNKGKLSIKNKIDKGLSITLTIPLSNEEVQK